MHRKSVHRVHTSDRLFTRFYQLVSFFECIFFSRSYLGLLRLKKLHPKNDTNSIDWLYIEFIDSTGLYYIMFTGRVYKLYVYMIPGCPLKITK